MSSLQNCLPNALHYQITPRFLFIAKANFFAKTKEPSQGNILYINVTFPCKPILKITSSTYIVLQPLSQLCCCNLFLIADVLSLLVDLLGLLNWRSNSQNIAHNLRKLMEVEGGEIVKVCRDLSLLAMQRLMYVLDVDLERAVIVLYPKSLCIGWESCSSC